MPELTIKTYLPLANGQYDIRRFTINTEESNFASVQQKIGGNYDLQVGSFKILWTDIDGDALTIANDEDFANVLKNASDLVKFNLQRVRSCPRVFPQPNMDCSDAPSSSGQQVPEDPDLHSGITCDGCNSQIRGTRYKCLCCKDFDLCAACESKNTHNDHLVLKVPKPNMPHAYPIMLLARALRDAKEMASQGREYCHSAMGSMPNPQDYMDLNNLGQTLTTLLSGLGIDANYFVQNPHFRPPTGFCSPGASNGTNPCGSASSAASAALERRVNETMEHLRSMGFQDDNGSLSSLVRSKNGDLFAVLDILKAQQQ